MYYDSSVPSEWLFSKITFPSFTYNIHSLSPDELFYLQLFENMLVWRVTI